MNMQWIRRALLPPLPPACGAAPAQVTGPNFDPPPTVVAHPAVADAALAAGAELLYDMGALPTGENARVAARHRAGLVIMHSVGEPKVAHTHVRYDDVMQALDAFFREKIELALAAGLPRESIVLDPGIDFAKQRDDNLRIYRELERLTHFGRPILLPVSRKTVIGEVPGLPDPADPEAGPIAGLGRGKTRGTKTLPVHNIAAAAQAIRTVRAMAG